MSEANHIFEDRDFFVWRSGDKWLMKRRCSENPPVVFFSREQAVACASYFADREGNRVIVSWDGNTYNE